MVESNSPSSVQWLEDEIFMEQCDEKTADADRLAVSLHFGINTAIHKEIMQYLERNGEEASKLTVRYALNSIGPAAAKEFRKIGLAYAFFEKGLPRAWKSQEERHDYVSLRRLRYLDVKNIDPVIFRFFQTKFGDAFTGKLD